ncbi:MAG: alpha/beta fold hydrolase [Anaerolineales bacterium]
MLDTSRLIYLHGSESDSNSGKARLFREWFPGMLTPDFTGSFDERMRQLYSILTDQKDWVPIGSSYGGLMGTMFTLEHPDQVRKLVLLAPALMLDPLASLPQPKPVPVPTIVIHGTRDTVVPLEPVRAIVQKLFTSVEYHVVEDDHRLGKSVHELDWNSILA